MKFISTIILWAFYMCANAQEVPNGDFESWGLNDIPSDWTCSNTEGFQHVFQDSLSHEAELAMQVHPLSSIEAGPGSAITSINLGSIPSNLGFFAKVSFDIHDSIFVKVQFLNQDYLVYEEVWTAEEEMLDWSQVIIELNQIEPVLDECRIIVQCGYGESLENYGNTWISVDAMEFEATPVTIDELSNENHITVFPNPTQNELNFTSSTTHFDRIEIKDTNGKTVLLSPKSASLDISTLQTGSYYVVFYQEKKLVFTEKFIKY